YMLRLAYGSGSIGIMAISTASLLIQHIRELVAPETARLSDRELLTRFIAERDQAAFAALVQRHGPLVWHVCRRGLPHEADAEDASQATFLVLCRKAGSVRRQASVGSWLYGVAYRVALQARTVAARKRAAERRVAPKSAVDPLAEVTVREAQVILDE